MSQANPTEVQANAYAENFILYGDKTRAFRAAFPDSKSKGPAQNVTAFRLHESPKIHLIIEELQKTLKKQSEEQFTLSVGWLKEQLQSAIKKGLEDKEIMVSGPDGKRAKVKVGGAVSISGAVSAIAEINKMDGNHAATKLALGGDKDNPLALTLLSDDAINLRLNALEKSEDGVC